jgi:transcriptional regulator of arginine metabolism
MHEQKMEKEKRQQKILSLIRARNVGTQQELTELLERAGVVATQSSISRDLVEMGVVKRHGFYTMPQNENGAAARGLFALEAVGANLVIARCEPGLASAVAVEIDRAHVEEIVGTLAGEDTIFIAVRDAKAGRAAIRRIWELFG